MEDTLSNALVLLVVGMCTVFVILMLIINFSKLLIMFINKVCPEDVVAERKNTNNAAPAIDPKMANIITQAMNKVANGAKIVEIKKI